MDCRSVLKSWLYLSLVIISGLLAACGASDVPGVYFPKHQPDPSRETALLEGTLRYRNGCLWIDDRNGSKYLAVWPDAYRAVIRDTNVAVARGDQLLASDNGQMEVSGGEAAELHGLQLVASSPAPKECANPPRYWVVTEIQTR